MKLEDRKKKEIEHSDRRRTIVKGYEYNTDASPDQLIDKFVEGNEDFEQHFSNMKFYSITRSSVAWRDKLLFANIEGAVALDYCCGNGEAAIEMAEHGAKKVVGIDISKVAIENAKELAKSKGVQEICDFRVMDAEHTEFADNTFDVIHEYGALHHLELKSAFSELARILKPEGKMLCIEALGHNPLIQNYRKKTPQLRTEWEFEHILRKNDIESAKKYFNKVEYLGFFHLVSIAAVPFRNFPIFNILLKTFEKIDSLLLKLPILKWQAWQIIFELSEPK